MCDYVHRLGGPQDHVELRTLTCCGTSPPNLLRLPNHSESIAEILSKLDAAETNYATIRYDE